MKHAALLVASLLLTGCASEIEPVPVAYNCPRLMLPDDPVPATIQLTDKSTPDEVIKAWVATAYAYRGWNQIVRKQNSV